MTALSASFGRMLGRLDPSRPAVAAAGARVVEALADGHVAVPVAEVGGAEALDGSPMVGRGGDSAPLVLDGDLLYLAAAYREEVRVAVRLRELAATRLPVDEVRLAATVRALFPPALAQVEQEAAVAASARRRLTVLAGGPGTGKTTTVVRVLAAIADQEIAAGRAAPRVMLLAPTGKAAARLGASVAGQAASLTGVAPEVRAALPTSAFTVHRALGAERGWRVRYRHGEDEPWPADVVVVDEASMVELPLLAAVCEALEPTARLVLVGDPDQLASVGSGSVLADLAGLPVHGTVGGAVSRLVQARRFAASGRIARAAAAVLAADVAGLREAADGEELSIAAPSAVAVVQEAAARWAEVVRAEGVEARLAALDGFRVLCALRQGPLGAEEIGAQIEAVLRQRGVIGGGHHVDGRPILVTANDPVLQLQNGDTGLLVRGPNGVRAVFRAPDGTVREFLPGRLPPHTQAFAMTVHKSQGSEFDAVAVVLPAESSPLLTAELLYTGLTRAKRQVTVYASSDRLAEAVAARVRRRSGLARRLAEEP